MKLNKSLKRREPLTDTQLLLTITICIFFGMYFLAMAIWGGGFLRWQQVFDMLNNNAALIIVACGLTIVMIGGGIDISVGGVTALVVMSCIVHMNNGGSIFTAVLLALGIGVAFGLVQGYLISYLEIQPFIITLAGMFFARGMTTIVSLEPQKIAHEGFKQLMKTKIEIPLLGYTAKNGNLIPARMEIGVVVALLIVVIVFILLKKCRLGRQFYAMGGNSQSAMMLGVNVKRTRFYSYLISGTLSGIAGFVFMMHTGAGNATNAAGAEMNAIASSIIGGTLLTGGVGNVIGTLFGVLTLTTIKSIVTVSGLRDPWWQSITTGAMLCFFIVLQSVVLANRGKGGLKKMLPGWLKKPEETDAGKL
ncbi:MAG: sugar ABC transporter permease YjfF [Clostridia bacterium]|nr:sugar ABC transporter permease YjfF [Clostridia bacterium]